MKDQLQTIRRAVEMATPHYQADTERFKQALAALAQIEAAVGEQEPVATVTSETGNPDISMSWWHEPALPVGTKLYTAPVVQQQEPDLTSLLFAVEQAVKNGHCPWEIEAAFDEYEAARKAAPVAQQPQSEAVPMKTRRVTYTCPACHFSLERQE